MPPHLGTTNRVASKPLQLSHGATTERAVAASREGNRLNHGVSGERAVPQGHSALPHRLQLGEMASQARVNKVDSRPLQRNHGVSGLHPLLHRSPHPLLRSLQHRPRHGVFGEQAAQQRVLSGLPA